MDNGITYRTQTELVYDDGDPVDRGAFIQIIRLQNGVVVCTYCASPNVDQNTQDAYGPMMMRLDPQRPNTPIEFDLREVKKEITETSAELTRAENARKKALSNPEKLKTIDDAMRTRFATTMGCDKCVRFAESRR